MDVDHDERARREARTVETVFALILGCATFVALAVAGWALGRLAGHAFDVALTPAVPALLVAAAGAGAVVTVIQLVRARRRGL